MAFDAQLQALTGAIGALAAKIKERYYPREVYVGMTMALAETSRYYLTHSTAGRQLTTLTYDFDQRSQYDINASDTLYQCAVSAAGFIYSVHHDNSIQVALGDGITYRDFVTTVDGTNSKTMKQIACDVYDNVYAVADEGGTVYKYDRDGTELWSHSVAAITESITPQDICVDVSGCVTVAAHNNSSNYQGGAGAVWYRLSADGQTVLNSGAAGIATAASRACACLPNGTYAVSINTVVYVYDNTDTLVWSHDMLQNVMGVEFDRDGNLYVIFDTSLDIRDPAGTQLLTHTAAGTLRSIHVDARGHIHYTCDNGTDTDLKRLLPIYVEDDIIIDTTTLTGDANQLIVSPGAYGAGHWSV